MKTLKIKGYWDFEVTASYLPELTAVIIWVIKGGHPSFFYPGIWFFWVSWNLIWTSSVQQKLLCDVVASSSLCPLEYRTSYTPPAGGVGITLSLTAYTSLQPFFPPWTWRRILLFWKGRNHGSLSTHLVAVWNSSYAGTVTSRPCFGKKEVQRQNQGCCNAAVCRAVCKNAQDLCCPYNETLVAWESHHFGTVYI